MRWPSFVNLFGAWFFLALIPLIILYFLKLRRPKMEVPSLVLWQSVVNDQRVNSPFQKFRRNLLLLLQIIMLCLLVLALMQPFLSADAEVAQYMPVLIDCSASMAATDEITGKSRLELVKEQVREQIEGLSGDQRMSLFSFSATGRRLTDFTSDRRQLLKALDLLEPTDLPGQLDDVLRMAAAYTRTFPIETVTIMTDGNLPNQVDFELPFSLDVRRVDPGGANVGVTEMSARRSGPQEWEVFVRVSGSSVDLRGAELKFFENNVETNSQPIEVSSDEAERLVFPVASAESRLLEARLVPSGYDSMNVDNSVWLTLPAARPLKVWTSPKLASWRHATRVLSNIELEDGADEKPKAPDYDLIISDSADLGGAIAPVQVFVGVIPDDLKTMIEVKEDVDNVVDWNRTAPFLRHVQLADLELGEQPRLATGISAKELEELGYEVLIDGKAGPLLLQRREGLSVSYWFTFHTDRSTLPYRVGFPIIAANAVEAALKQASLSEVSAAPTGVLPVISVEAERSYTIKTPDGQQIPATSTPAGTLTGIPAAKVGRYDILEGTDVATSIGTGLLNTTESSLKAVEALRFTETTVAAEKSERIDSDRPLWWTLALLAFGVMLFEWWYFQRARGARRMNRLWCDFMSRDTLASGWFFVLTWLVGITPNISIAADKPVVGLKMELMSIRNRSSGPLPVRFRLEYNQPQMLEGDLQLSIYDGQDFYTAEDLIAKLRFDDIVLVGQDYQFNAVLPPLRTSTMRNWSIEAVFMTEAGPIPLSSIVDKQNPPEAFDLITSNPAERSVLLCSCSADPIANGASQNRRFLESALSLENYNPLNQSTDSQSQTSPQEAVDTLAANMMGRSIIHFAGQWAARDLPLDPLSYCAFDVVLLSDGALARLNQDQLDGLSKWVRAGGSVCVVPDAPMKPMHLEMLRNLFAKPDISGTGLSLDDEGRLTVVSEENDPILMSHFGLGRALLLPAVESLESRLGKEDLGRVVAFLWKVRSDVGVWQGEKWSNADYLQQLKNLGIDAQKDEKGLYLTSEVRSKLRVRYLLGEQVNGRYYFDFQRMNSLFGIDDRLNPRTEPLLSVGEQLLLPEDSEMVPTWVIGLILTGYVLTIGPMDYFVLGWLHLRKYTWLVFPVVTLLFTFLTIAIAHSYMSSEDTGGRLVITDVVDDGIPVRQTILETLFLGARTEITTDCKSQLVVQAEDSFTSADFQNMNMNVPERKSDTPLNYSGHFPQNYSIQQEVQQWSPVSLRTLSLEPEGVRLPAIDWTDSTLITTSEGNQRLKAALAKNVDAVHSAVIYHNGSPLVLLGPFTKAPPDLANYFTNPTRTLRAVSRSAAIESLISYIPTAVPSQSGIFRLVSQIAPQGAGTFEDLAICDATDSRQWALVIMLTDGKEFQVFRKLYYVD